MPFFLRSAGLRAIAGVLQNAAECQDVGLQQGVFRGYPPASPLEYPPMPLKELEARHATRRAKDDLLPVFRPLIS